MDNFPVYGEVIKTFGKLTSGTQVAIVSESTLAYKVRIPSDLTLDAESITFIPKEKIALGLPVAAIAPIAPIVIPTPQQVEPPSDSGFSNKEQSILISLMDTGMAIGSSSFGNLKEEQDDSGVTETAFVPPKSAEERAKEAEAAKWEYARECLEPHSAPLLEEGTFWLSDLTEGKLPKSGVDHKITSYSIDSWDKDLLHDIPEVNIFYHWDANMLEAIHLAYSLNEKILITGLPGTGKTTAIQQYGAHIQQPYMRFNGKDGIEQSSFLGYPWATEDGMVWKDGILPIGLKLGYLVCLDEVFKIPAGIQMAMQNLYEKDGVLMLDDKPGEYHEKLVIPADTFRLMLTDNVRGTGDDFEKFGSTQIQDSSTLDRFGITYELGYMPQEQEEDMLRRMFPKSDVLDINRLVKFAGLIRTGYKTSELALTLSPRGLIATLSMMAKASIPLGIALDLAFVNKIAEDTEIQMIEQIRSTVGGL
jgi:MoxR-like ATPase